MRVLLDITRSVARARLPAPTGIDRVERAWIGWALRRPPRALFLARVGATQHLIRGDAVRRLLDWLDGEGPAPARDLRALNPLRDPRLARAQALVRRAGIDRAPAGDAATIAAMLRRAGLGPGGAYLNTGHDNLSDAVIAGTGAAGLARAVLVHDVIPLEHPQFARPGTPARFRARLDAALGADLLLCNSADTAARLARLAGRALPPVVVAPLGVEPARRAGAAGPAPGGGFVCLGTIEPRKNHALLLEVWDRLWHAQGADSPRLDIVGRRGWSNEAVFRTLDSAPFMGRSVVEHGALDDARAGRLLAGARALLFPSFAEGFGLPLAEALALGVPVIAADLPALAEVGGGVPEFLSPRDPAAWLRAVGDYAAEPSPRRAAQLARLAGWQAPGWEAHFRVAENALETILVQTARGG